MRGRHYDRGRVGDVVEDSLHVRLDLLPCSAAGLCGGVRAPDLVQIGSLVVVEAQDARERREHRRRRSDPALLEPRVVIGRDGCELRDLLAAKTSDAPLLPTLRQVDVAAAELGAASSKERTKLVLITDSAAHQPAHCRRGIATAEGERVIPGSAFPGRTVSIGRAIRA